MEVLSVLLKEEDLFVKVRAGVRLWAAEVL